MGIKHVEAVGSTFDEKSLSKSDYSTPECFVKACATAKALNVNNSNAEIVIAADTIVEFEGDILEKPNDAEHAKELLRRLAGKTHTVWSGVAIVDVRATKCDPIVFAEKTEVTLDELTEDIINEYVNTGDPLDKAGGYGIQSSGCILAKGINGCFYNVIGLPVNRLAKELRALG